MVNVIAAGDQIVVREIHMRVLLVEDEVRLARLIRTSLREEAHAVDIASDGEDGLMLALHGDFDIVILDVMLPRLDGLTVCKRLRAEKKSVPILLLTARDSVEDRVAGLDSGADDYLVKPFATVELIARMRAVTRRPGERHDTVYQRGQLRLDPSSHRVWMNSREVRLPNKEFRILEYFIQYPNLVLTREMIANRVWDYDSISFTNVIDVYIRQLRKKLDDPGHTSVIETVRGVGYRLGACP